MEYQINKHFFSILLFISFLGCSSDYGTFRGVANEIQPLRDKLSSSNAKIQQESINNNSVDLDKVYQSMNSCIYSLNQFLNIMDRFNKNIESGKNSFHNLRPMVSDYLKQMRKKKKLFLGYLEPKKGLSDEILKQIEILNRLDIVYEKYSNEYAN